MATTQDTTANQPAPTKTDEESRQTTAALKEKLHQYLEGARKRFAEVIEKIDSLREDDRQSLQRQRDESQQRMTAQKDREQELRANADDWQREREVVTEKELTSWRDNHEANKLQSHADRAEEYAVNAVVIAMMEVDEVEQAVLEALALRIDADAAVGS
jgi:hypothetical protein